MKTNNNTTAESAAPSFDAIIQAGRKKRKNEDLANQILGSSSNRSKKASSLNGVTGRNLQARRSTGSDRSLASRVGVTKRPVSIPRGPKQQSGSVWSQARKSNDNTRLLRRSQQSTWGIGGGGDDGYGSTMTATGGRGRSGLNETGQGRLDNDRGSELSIRGMAGPYTVVASNFAPGTTAADISAVMEPVGGEMLSCHLVSSNPTVIAEMVFSERDGADNVVAMFNNKRADGRLLYVYLKVGAPHKFNQTAAPRAGSGVSGSFRPDSDLMDTSYDAPSQPRSGIERSREPGLQDGRYGFSDIESRGKANTGRIRSDQGLFSDRMVQRNQNYRR